jgi:hypothetical protein
VSGQREEDERSNGANIVEDIMRFEDGEMDTQEEVIEFFQKLVDSGLAWSLQGSYGRMAANMIEQGYITPGGEG